MARARCTALFPLLLALLCAFSTASCDSSFEDVPTTTSAQAQAGQPAIVARVLFGGARGQLFLNNGVVTPRNVRLQGRQPLANQTVVVNDSRLGLRSTETDELGNFLLPELTAGEQLLTVPALNLTFPITVIGGAEVLIQTTPVSRDQAIAAVMQVLNARADFRLDESFIIAPHNPLPTGVPLTQALGAEDPGVDPTPVVNTLTSPQWLVYVDPTPMVPFHHKLEYFLVDAQTGAVTTENRTAYPSINGVAYYQDSGDHLQSTALVESPLVAGETIPARAIPEAKATPAAVRAQEDGPASFVFIIDGHNTTSSRADVRKFKEAILPNITIPPVAEQVEINTAQLERADGVSLEQAVLSQFLTLVAKPDPEDTVVVYITSHGNTRGAILSGTKFTTEDDTVLSWSQFDFGDCRACEVVVIVEACHAGGFVRELGGVPTQQFGGLDKPGRKYALLGAAQQQGPPEGNAVAIPSYLLEIPTGGLYTTFLQEQIVNQGNKGVPILTQLSLAHEATRQRLNTVSFNFARATTQRIARRMNSPIFIDRADGEFCEGVGDPPDPNTPSAQFDQFQAGDDGTVATTNAFSFTHIVGCDPVPVLVGTFRVTNPNSSPSQVGLTAGSHVRLRRTGMTPAIDLDLTLAGGASEVVEVLFVGSTSTSFNSGITAVTSGPGGAANLNILVQGTLLPALTVSPGFLTDIHNVGISPCPDPVGSVTLTNNCRTPQDFQITPQGFPVFTDPAAGTIPANSSMTVDVFFDCSTITSFTRTITAQLLGVPAANAIPTPAQVNFDVQMTIVD